MSTHEKRKNCVVHCRVSSLKQSYEGESLENQEESIRRFVANRGWHIVPDGKVWSATISGRKTDSEYFNEILEYIKANPGYIDFYLFKAIDRFTRAGTPEYDRMKKILTALGVQMVDLQGVIQPERNMLEEQGFEYDWSMYSPSEITENIMSTNAKQEVGTILVRMIGQQINLTKQGYRMRRPLDGYVNEHVYVEGKKKPIQKPDPVRAHFYTAMFEMRARGVLDIEIVEKINAMGFKSRTNLKWDKDHRNIIGNKGGLPLTIKQLQRIIINPVYAGVVCEKWTHYKPIKAAYPGLVSVELFNRANKGKWVLKIYEDDSVELIQGKDNKSGKTRLRNNPLFPYKFILDECGCPFLGSSPKSKSGKYFPTYHCARSHKYFGVPKDDFEENVEKYIKNLQFHSGFIDALELTMMNKYREREKEIVQTSSDIHRSIADLQAEQAAKLNAIVATTSSIVREKLENDIEGLETRIKAARKERLRIEITESDIQAFKREAKKIMEHPAELLLNPTDIAIQRGLF
ncbi:MAG: hydrolase, partial [Candidatus Taylorbacteria bacterium]|nr:hydrolase [Candidatus Taylorbacteria bacterium]